MISRLPKEDSELTQSENAPPANSYITHTDRIIKKIILDSLRQYEEKSQRQKIIKGLHSEARESKMYFDFTPNSPTVETCFYVYHEGTHSWIVISSLPRECKNATGVQEYFGLIQRQPRVNPESEPDSD